MGRPKLEPTKIMNFRLPESTAEAVRLKYGNKLTKMFKEWINQISK